MKLVCAWCKRVIREGAEENPSHGICQDCVRRISAEDDQPIRFDRGWAQINFALKICAHLRNLRIK